MKDQDSNLAKFVDILENSFKWNMLSIKENFWGFCESFCFHQEWHFKNKTAFLKSAPPPEISLSGELPMDVLPK